MKYVAAWHWTTRYWISTFLNYSFVMATQTEFKLSSLSLSLSRTQIVFPLFLAHKLYLSLSFSYTQTHTHTHTHKHTHTHTHTFSPSLCFSLRIFFLSLSHTNTYTWILQQIQIAEMRLHLKLQNWGQLNNFFFKIWRNNFYFIFETKRRLLKAPPLIPRTDTFSVL